MPENQIMSCFTVETGKNYQFTSRRQTGQNQKGELKFEVCYDIPLKVQWEGIVKETKQPCVEHDTTLTVGDKVKLSADVRTKIGKSGSHSSCIDVTLRAETT